jgi:hypothetical protein
MSGTKRHPLQRPRQRSLISEEALRLFIELENTPRAQRGTKSFKDRQHELMRLLNLVPEYWTTNSVLDDSKAPPWPPHLVAYQDWHKVRGVREELLQACKAAA